MELNSLFLLIKWSAPQVQVFFFFFPMSQFHWLITLIIFLGGSHKYKVLFWILFWSIEFLYRNPNLGLVTNAKAYEGESQEWAQESHFMLSGVQKGVREWTLTLPSELPFWELESQ
jgi:hypothetical protein